MSADVAGIVEALHFQHLAVNQKALSSPLYECVLESVLQDEVVDDDDPRGGPTLAILAQAPPGLDPIPDALVLRFLGTLHRLVLEGRLPELAALFPSAGGSFDPSDDAARAALVAAYRAALATHHDDLVAGLSHGVQTNEVGRSAALAVGFLEVARTAGLPLRLLEIGASAGLNLRWHRYRYEGGAEGSSFGPPDSAVRFTTNYSEPLVDLSGDAVVAARVGCDRAPIDASTHEGRIALMSFVWPDQSARYALLAGALDVAAADPVTVEPADAAEWLAARLAEPADGLATVVFHSIVWQYLPPETQASIRRTLDDAGAAASAGAPLAWLRMEPGEQLSKAAEVRLRTWPSGADAVIARAGYHGRPVRAVTP